MESFSSGFLLLVALYSFISFILGIRQRKNPFGLSPFFGPIGSFVWVDNFIFGLFFAIVSVFCFLTSQWILFWLIFSVFWLIRSIGEQIYWFLEQFAHKHRNPPKTLWPHKWFRGEEVWIVMQIFWQCVSVIALIATVYFFVQWLK